MQHRSFVQADCAWTAMGGAAAAQAQQRQRTHWQIMGKKGLWNGRSYMDAEPDKKHPAELLAK